MLSIAAALALSLGVIGIYAVISYTVSLRKREIGIRLALGSPEAKVRDLFLIHGLKLSAIGVVLGLAVSIPLSRLMSALLYQVSPMDPLTYVLVAFALIAAAALCRLPSRPSRRQGLALGEPIEFLGQNCKPKVILASLCQFPL